MSVVDKLARLKARAAPVATQESPAPRPPDAEPARAVEPARARPAKKMDRFKRVAAREPSAGPSQPDAQPIALVVERPIRKLVKDPQPAAVPENMPDRCACCGGKAKNWYVVEGSGMLFSNGVQVSRLTPEACCTLSCAREIADPYFKVVACD